MSGSAGRGFWVVLLCLGLLPGLAKAEPRPFVGPVISTLGLGLEAGVRLNERFGLRLGGNYFQLSFDRTIDEIDYDADAELGSIGALADVYPFGGGFRVTGGLRLNFNQAELTGRGNGTVEIDDVVFDADDVGTLDGDVDYDTVAPYLGIGYGGAMLGGALLVTFDLGVMYQGSPDVALTADGVLADDPALLAALENEEQKVEDDLDDYQFYPVAGIALTYRF